MFSTHNKIHKDKGLAPTEFEEQVAQEYVVRLKVALGAAKGLAFLHGSETRVIYRDFKTCNILLDSEYNAKLSDFGLANDGPVRDNMQLLNISPPVL